jgi:hypothetical protein
MCIYVNVRFEGLTKRKGLAERQHGWLSAAHSSMSLGHVNWEEQLEVQEDMAGGQENQVSLPE